MLTTAHIRMRGVLADKSAAQASLTIASGNYSADVMWSQLTIVDEGATAAADIIVAGE